MAERDYARLLIPFGPVHPAFKEPIHFRIVVKKEEVVDVDVRLGYVHRGVEALAETRNLIQALYLTERICGICSHSHATCFVQALEEIGGIRPPDRALYLRTLIAELERMHSHLLWLGTMAYEIGFDTLFMYAWRAREKVMDVFEEVTGNRIHHSMNTIGGVRWDLDLSMIGKVYASVGEVEKAVRYIHDVFQDKSVEGRLCRVGLLSHDSAKELCVVGPTARGSRIEADVRKDDLYAAYADLRDAFSVVVRCEGDAYARTEVRIFELFESINLVRAVLDKLPGGPIALGESALKLMTKVPEGEAISRVEAPRGELVYFVKTDGRGGLKRLKVRTPTLANVISLRTMLIGGEIADVPVAIASIDPCISCADRVTIIDGSEGKFEVVSFESLRRRGRLAC